MNSQEGESGGQMLTTPDEVLTLGVLALAALWPGTWSGIAAVILGQLDILSARGEADENFKECARSLVDMLLQGPGDAGALSAQSLGRFSQISQRLPPELSQPLGLACALLQGRAMEEATNRGRRKRRRILDNTSTAFMSSAPTLVCSMAAVTVEVISGEEQPPPFTPPTHPVVSPSSPIMFSPESDLQIESPTGASSGSVSVDLLSPGETSGVPCGTPNGDLSFDLPTGLPAGEPSGLASSMLSSGLPSAELRSTIPSGISTSMLQPGSHFSVLQHDVPIAVASVEHSGLLQAGINYGMPSGLSPTVPPSGMLSPAVMMSSGVTVSSTLPASIPTQITPRFGDTSLVFPSFL